MKQETGKLKKVEKTVENTIRKHNLAAGDMHIVLGLSGGPDSVCLFDVLQRISEASDDMNFTIHPVHINHKFRPGAAEEDQLYTEQLCESRGLRCSTFVFDCGAIAQKLKLTSEEAGRKVRYESFAEVASEIEKNGVDRSRIAIAVAQNANDQCETVLFRIMRGTGTDGLSGIAYKRKDEWGYNIIRPLLDVYRSDIESYCQEAGLNPRIDHTNEEAVYTRNKIRLELLPYLRQNFNENVDATINRLAEIASEDSEYLNEQAQKIYEEACAWERGSDSLSCSEAAVFTEPLNNIHVALRYRVYNIALGRVGLYDNISRAHIEAIERVRISSSPSASADVGGGYTAAKAYDKIIFRAAYEAGGRDSQNMSSACIDDNIGRYASPEYQYVQNSAGRHMQSPDVKHMQSPDSKQVQNSDNQNDWQLEIIKIDELEGRIKNAAAKGHAYGAFGGDAPEFFEKIEIRTRRKGDYIALKGGKKKIQDFFVDCKVPKIYRDRIQLLALGNRILWVMPSPFFAEEAYRSKGRFSADFAVDSEKDNNIIFLENKRNLC